ncbi:hypothetical protein BGZ60DRAFT_548337 [Tricladium varicosporioides]|nr:hypothetical protein BGZ60DRAFT_548337 [Hymenoscyphus varicosporioides]
MRWDVRFQECKNERGHFKSRSKNILHDPDCNDHKVCSDKLTQEQKFWDRKGACPSCLFRGNKVQLGQTEAENGQNKAEDIGYHSRDAQDAFEDGIDGSRCGENNSEDKRDKPKGDLSLEVLDKTPSNAREPKHQLPTSMCRHYYRRYQKCQHEVSADRIAPCWLLGIVSEGCLVEEGKLFIEQEGFCPMCRWFRQGDSYGKLDGKIVVENMPEEFEIGRDEALGALLFAEVKGNKEKDST